MGPRHLFTGALLLAACGGEKETQVRTDAPIQPPQGCTSETDCSGTTPYCETSKSECVQCRLSSHCSATNGVCDGNACRNPRSCQELHDQLPALTSGVYKLDVDDAGPAAAFDAYCDMTTDGGGWTLIQRTRWAWAASQALSTNYDTWYDTSIGTPGVGAAYRLAGVSWTPLLQKKQLMIAHSLRTASGSACNPLYYVGTDVTLAVDKTTKSTQITSITQPVSIVAYPSGGPATLSTTDSGADSAQCVNGAGGVPWFYGACCSTCPTYAGSYWTDPTAPHPMVSYTGTTADFFGKLEGDVCSSAVQMSEMASGYRGVDTMEMYIR